MEDQLIQPTTIEELQTAVRDHSGLVARGGGTKLALSRAKADVHVLSLANLSGIIEYNPSEYTFTAMAGTRLSDVIATLAEHHQYLPFDPLLVKQGATLGGTLAAGLSGPGRYRYGGLRDFILGVKFIDGNGQLVRGGGKVVKNAAGFDIPKLLVGSLGMFGVLVELTFKVFPKPAAHTTIVHHSEPLESALQILYRIYTARLEIDSLNLEPIKSGLQIAIRLAGLPEALPARAQRVRELLGDGEVYSGAEDAAWAEKSRAFQNAATLIKVPLTPKHIRAIESRFGSSQELGRHYSAGGNVVWLTGEGIPPDLTNSLLALNLAGLVVKGDATQVRIGHRTGQVFEQRIKQVFDPLSKFPNY